MISRMRIFAGPNGSGKSTLAHWLSRDYAVNLYRYINADDLFAEIKETQKTACPFSMDMDSLLSYIQKTTYPDVQKGYFLNSEIQVKDESVIFAKEAINSYTVALLADYYRHEYILRGESFSFETVFSHPSKIEILKEAKCKGYRTYLYFISTENPKINLTRISSRVLEGGHDVPNDKIISRFQRCLENVSPALSFLDRAYFFDNTETDIRFIAEMNEGKWISYTPVLPQWFVKSVFKNSQ